MFWKKLIVIIVKTIINKNIISNITNNLEVIMKYRRSNFEISYILGPDNWNIFLPATLTQTNCTLKLLSGIHAKMRMVKKTSERQYVQFSRTQLTQITFLICVPINYIHNFEISEMPKKSKFCMRSRGSSSSSLHCISVNYKFQITNLFKSM